MGHFSDLAIIEGERRLNLKPVEGKRVCSACFRDPHLSRVIEEDADANKCDYCGNSGKRVLAAPLSTVVEFMLPQIELEYASADQSLPTDPETKGRMFPEDEFDTRDMLETYVGLELPNDHRGELMADIAKTMPEQDWCLVNPLGTPDDEAIGNSWEAFKRTIKHRRRFFFLQHKDRDLAADLSWGQAAYDIPELLERITQFVNDHGLIRRLGKGSLYFRCQSMSDGEQAFGARRMGPPPYDCASLPNRMSPAGVPMFYGADERETALAEIAAGPGRFAAGRFEVLREVLVLDVRKAPPVPSLFDTEFAKDRAIAMFMHSFIEDFRAPIDRERRPHVDYLPTQVITEYFRTMVLQENTPIEGVLYSSTKDSKDAIVLFAESEDVVDEAEVGDEERDPWLRMVEYEEIMLEQPPE